ncbi:hypothetical protein IJT10_07025 [bacterium]|nr:hypothetical protein [bacterium]
MDKNEEMESVHLYSTLPLFDDEVCSECLPYEEDNISITYEKRGEDREFGSELRNQIYGLHWPGKFNSKLKSQAPIDAYLRFCPEKSFNEDDSKNICIEGDSLLTLKFLKNDYEEKIKVIYIDLSYKILDNSCKDKNKRIAYWLSDVYEKLNIAKDLLSNNGLIFLIVEGNELADLILICYEIFGRDNLLGIFPRLTNRSSKTAKVISQNNDFIVAFSRSEDFTLNLPIRSDKGGVKTRPISTLDFIDNRYSNDKARKDLIAIFGKKIFDSPKPVNLVRDLLCLASDSDSLILDLSSKSGVVGQAVLELNAQDNGRRNFILADVGDNVAERVRAIGKKLQKEDDFSNLWMDLGFKYFHIVDTFKEVDK